MSPSFAVSWCRLGIDSSCLLWAKIHISVLLGIFYTSTLGASNRIKRCCFDRCWTSLFFIWLHVTDTIHNKPLTRPHLIIVWHIAVQDPVSTSVSAQPSVSCVCSRFKNLNVKQHLSITITHIFFFKLHVALLLAITIKKFVVMLIKQCKLLYSTYNNIKIIIISESDELHI